VRWFAAFTRSARAASPAPPPFSASEERRHAHPHKAPPALFSRADPQLFSRADDGAMVFIGDWDAVQALSENDAEQGGLTAALAGFARK
jgi:hypothetical protein